MIKLDSLCHSFGENVLFKDISATFCFGIHALVGKSGAGKTTLLRIIAGLQNQTEGHFEADCPISVSFQENRLFPWYTSLKNVSIVSDEKTAQKLLNELGVGEAANKFPNQLSGGMQRRVSLARALAFPSKTVLLDEPFSGLDDATAEMTLDIIKKYTDNKTVLISTHNIKIAEMLDSITEI